MTDDDTVMKMGRAGVALAEANKELKSLETDRKNKLTQVQWAAEVLADNGKMMKETGMPTAPEIDDVISEIHRVKATKIALENQMREFGL